MNREIGWVLSMTLSSEQNEPAMLADFSTKKNGKNIGMKNNKIKQNSRKTRTEGKKNDE